MKAIILAGGGGTRLWPLSREDFPKQFLSFGVKGSLLQMTAQRLLDAPFIDQIVVATNKDYFLLVKKQLGKIEHKVEILVEPFRKNTAPAIGLAVKYLQQFCNAQDEEPILVVPSDHLIEPVEIFLHTLEQMEHIVQDGGLVTFGIRPMRPETGYGYIQIGAQKHPFVFEAARFIEKPDLPMAQKYLADARFYWNSGMFMFSASTFWEQLSTYSPDIYSLMRGTYAEIMARFEYMPNLSIDYAIMEKSREILVCPLPVQWSDVGSWDSVYEAMEKDHNQNVKVGRVVDIETKNSLIVGGKRLISTIGLEDMLIVETEDVLFISKKGESQRVKKLLQELIQKGHKEETVYSSQDEQIVDSSEEVLLQR